MRLALVTAMAGACLILTASGAAADPPQGGSELDGWKVSAEVFIDGGSAAAEAWIGQECPGVHTWIVSYNEADPWLIDPIRYPVDFMFSIHEGKPGQSEALANWIEDNGAFIPSYIQIWCTSIHYEGWKPAEGWLIDNVGGGDPRVTITTDDPIACEYGQVLMANSTYYYWNGGWASYYGDYWTESYGGPGGISISGEVDFQCMEIIPGGPGDLTSVAEAVPTSQVNRNPLIQGLTGLDTWLWYDFTVPQSAVLPNHSASVTARGETWSLTTNVWVDQVHWDVDCAATCSYRGMAAGFDFGGYEYLLDLPDTFDLVSEPAVLEPAAVYDGGDGTEAEAAATHVYRTKDGYTLSTATVWRGFYEFLGVIYPYDSVVVAEGDSYEVVEIRSLPIAPEG